jgi:signal transduction histidine kinase
LNNIKTIKQPEILLIDDTPEHIETVVSALKQYHFRIRVASRGSTGLKLLKDHQPDLILLDIYMPEMDGFEVCKQIKNDDNLCDIPVIFFTARNDEESIKKGFELGGQDYVTKPFHLSELLARVNTHIKLKQQNESLKEAYQELDSFCYSVSHDLKAPLCSIDKLAEYLLSDCLYKLDKDDQELITNIHDKSKEVITMIDRLLEFSKMCKSEINYQTIDLTKTFTDIYDELILLHADRTVKLQLSELPQLQGDPVMIKLLVSNLLSNAFKFTGIRNTAIIEVTCSESSHEYTISVKDNGVGFDMRHSAKLFGVFQRLHPTSEFEGSGVGLAIIQRIIKRHHGQVWITGEVNNGATLTFRLPKNIN